MPSHLDIKKIRRNWEMAGRVGDQPEAGKLAPVRPPLDPFAAARGDLARIRELLASEFADHQATLQPFLTRIEAAIDGLAAAEGNADADADALRAELQDALFDTEDLLEVFSMPPR